MPFSFANDLQHKSTVQKQQLLNCMREQKHHFSQLAETYYARSERNDEHYYSLCQEVINTVEKITNRFSDDKSLFIRSTLKPLVELSEQAQLILNNAGLSTQAKQFINPNINDHNQFVYISLFQSKGLDLTQWELQLRSISNHIVGRPVYETEQQIARVVHQKLRQHNEAYITASVAKNKINAHAHLPERRDGFGNRLLQLSANAVNADNIIEFVHQGIRYHFHDGRLLVQTQN